jgi:hypothetical protein
MMRAKRGDEFELPIAIRSEVLSIAPTLFAATTSSGHPAIEPR